MQTHVNWILWLLSHVLLLAPSCPSPKTINNENDKYFIELGKRRDDWDNKIDCWAIKFHFPFLGRRWRLATMTMVTREWERKIVETNYNSLVVRRDWFYRRIFWAFGRWDSAMSFVFVSLFSCSCWISLIHANAFHFAVHEQNALARDTMENCAVRNAKLWQCRRFE